MSVNLTELQTIFDHIEAGKCPSPQELQILKAAAQSQQITIATGERAVAISGSADGVVIMTGDGNRNVVITGADAEAIRQVLDEFQLKDFPNPQKDWAQLLEQTKENLVAVPDKIGNSVFLLRQVKLEAIETAFETSKVVVLLGASGCGKTVIAKSWAERELSSNQVIWWNARSFDVSDFQSFQSRLGLSHPLRELLAIAPAPRAYVVIDGLDRLFSEAAFQNLSMLIQALQLNVKTSPWRILIPCQLEEWNRVQMQLARANNLMAAWEIVPVKEPSIDDLDPVWKTFPALGRLRYQPQLQSLLLKPKVLDLLATKLSIGDSVDTTQWVGESNLIEWFWETEVSKQTNARVRAAFLKALGEKQADNLESETPTDTFSISDLVSLDSLIGDRLCREREERLSFYHDLYGDWARQRVLLGKTNSLQEYIKPRASSPLWHRAVRLYGLHLLEKNEDTEAWRSALISLYGDNNTPDSTSDLLLEAVIFAANPLPLLEHIWSDLAANDGLLLRRLLIRFLHIATVPNPVILAIASQLGSDLETTAATIQRIPYWPYWLPMLRFLHTHLADVTNLAPKQIAEVADTWLRRGIESWPLRQEAAELALVTAEQLLRSRQTQEFPYGKEELRETIYHAALAGVHELPERVANFALEASFRREVITQEYATDTQSEPLVTRVINDPVYGTYELELPESTWSLIDDPEQDINPIIFRNFSEELEDEEEEPLAWPDGPMRKVDSAFRKVCLTTDALHPLIISNPSIAREVLLAVLIEEPRGHPRSRGIWDDNLRIASNREWYPPFYTQGPLLSFIKYQPIEGLELILRLVNFATERWADSWRYENQTVPEVTIPILDAEHKWIGDKNVYYWYDSSHNCPYPIVVALMILEKWFYDEINENKSVDTAIELILQRSNSVAFAGLLSAVGRKSLSLFQGPLRQLLAVPEFHIWEFQYRVPSQVFSSIGWLGKGEQIVKLVREWYELPHRKHGLHLWAKHFFLNIPNLRTSFEEFRSNWLTRLQVNSKEYKLKWYLEKLVDEYNIENYKVQNYPGNGDCWVFESPKKLNEKEKALREGAERELLLLSFPFQCKEILNEAQPLPNEKIEPFWNSIQQIAGFSVGEDEFGCYDIENSVCGGIAVLLQLHWNWVQQHPVAEKWCLDQLIRIIQKPPKGGRFSHGESNLGWEWDIFCAQTIPLIWSKFPDSNIWRECVALLATSPRYAVVSTVFAYVAKFRSSIYEDFKRLQHLIFRWAAVRWKWERTRYGSESSLDLEAERHREIKAFLEKSLSPVLPTLEEVAIQVWEELSDIEPHEAYNQPGLFGPRQPRQFPGLDLRLIQAAYTWLPSLEQAISKAERIEWVTFWKEALHYSLQNLERDTSLDGWAMWLFPNLATLITQLQPTEKRESFWQPILSLGVSKHSWIENFLRQWFVSGLSSKTTYDTLVRECREMVEFAFSSPNWKFDPTKHEYDLKNMWCCLIGLDWSFSNMWTVEHKPIIRQMYGLYERWASEHLNKPRCALKFTIFLTQSAAEDLRIDSLVWLDVASQSNTYFWDEQKLVERLASVLDICWRLHQSKLRRHHNSFSAFKNLLKKLADFQNPLALEIQQKIVSMQ